MKPSLVSIIVPCFNGDIFVDRCLTSIYNQSYREIEIIVVDDGSFDNSKEKILAWSDKFETSNVKLKYIYQQNKGPAGAINTGLQHVEGEYLTLLDIDDEYLPECIKERVEFLRENPNIDVVRTNGFVVRKTDKYLFVQSEDEIYIDVFNALLRGETNNWAGSYMIRTSALFDFYPNREIYESRYGQNLQLLLPLTYQKKCGFINHPHMNYIQQEQSLSQVPTLKKALENAKGYLDIRIHMLNEIVQDENAKKALLAEIYEGYWKEIMRLADCHRDKKLMASAYENFQQYKKPDINDKILYYGVCKRPWWYAFRLMRKCGFK